MAEDTDAKIFAQRKVENMDGLDTALLHLSSGVKQDVTNAKQDIF